MGRAQPGILSANSGHFRNISQFTKELSKSRLYAELLTSQSPKWSKFNFSLVEWNFKISKKIGEIYEFYFPSPLLTPSHPQHERRALYWFPYVQTWWVIISRLFQRERCMSLRSAALNLHGAEEFPRYSDAGARPKRWRVRVEQMERIGNKAPAKARMYELSTARSKNVWRMRDKERNLLGSIIAKRSLDDFPFYVHSLAAAANANVISFICGIYSAKQPKHHFGCSAIIQFISLPRASNRNYALSGGMIRDYAAWWFELVAKSLNDYRRNHASKNVAAHENDFFQLQTTILKKLYHGLASMRHY